MLGLWRIIRSAIVQSAQCQTSFFLFMFYCPSTVPVLLSLSLFSLLKPTAFLHSGEILTTMNTTNIQIHATISLPIPTSSITISMGPVPTDVSPRTEPPSTTSQPNAVLLVIAVVCCVGFVGLCMGYIRFWHMTRLKNRLSNSQILLEQGLQEDQTPPSNYATSKSRELVAAIPPVYSPTTVLSSSVQHQDSYALGSLYPPPPSYSESSCPSPSSSSPTSSSPSSMLPLRQLN